MTDVQKFILNRAMQKVANGIDKEAGIGSLRALKNARNSKSSTLAKGLDYLANLFGISRKMDVNDDLINILRNARYVEASKAGADALNSLPQRMKNRIRTGTVNTPYPFGAHNPAVDFDFTSSTDLSKLHDTLENFKFIDKDYWFDGMNPNYVKRQLQRAKAAQDVIRKNDIIPNSVFRKGTYDSVDDAADAVRKTLNYINK